MTTWETPVRRTPDPDPIGRPGGQRERSESQLSGLVPVPSPVTHTPAGSDGGVPGSPPGGRPESPLDRLRRSYVRRVTEPELVERGTRIQGMVAAAPRAGANLWIAQNSEHGVTVHLLGTHHGLHLTQVAAWQGVVRYLKNQAFSHVYSETTGAHDYRSLELPNSADALIDDLVNKTQYEAQQVQLAQQPADDPATSRQIKVVGMRLANIQSRTGRIDDVSLDDAYVALAMTGAQNKAAKRGVLETTASRDEATAQNIRDKVRTDNPAAAANVAASKQMVAAGDQQQIFADDAQEKLAGIDAANAEERNRQWMAGFATPEVLKKGDTQLWIVGAAHLPGLFLRFKDLGWQVEHQVPA